MLDKNVQRPSLQDRSYDVSGSFNRTGHALARHKILSEQLPQGLGINRCFAEWALHWDRIFNMNPKDFHQTLSRDIPGEVRVFLDLDHSGTGEFNISINEGNRTVFEAQNLISSGATGTAMKFDSWENKNVEGRGRGIGVTLLRNILDVCGAGDLRNIHLRAGREDGHFFWPRHGFHCRSAFDLGRIAGEVRENIKTYAPHMPAETLKAAEDIMAEGGLDSCYRLARLEGSVMVKDRVRPLGWALLKTPSEGYYEIDLTDRQQLAQVRATLQRPASVPSSAARPLGPAL